MASTVAIDFGTSRTKLAYWDPISHRPQLMRFQRDEPFLPSLFYLAPASEQILWGAEAEEMLHDDPAGVVAVLKRQLRHRYVRANRRRVEPGKLLTVLFAHLREQVGKQVAALAGQSPSAVRLTLPALYGPTEEGMLRAAATEAGFEYIEVVSEPVAAARAWLAETQDASQEVVVLDCGGGTSDWAYLHHQGEDFRLVSHCPPGGDTAVGGHDVDLELVELLKERLEEGAVSELEDQTAYYLQQVRILKERYCRGLAGHPLKIGGRSVGIEGKEIQAVIEARFVTQVCEGLKGYLAKVKEATGRALPTVLLVGGSAQLKGLREAIETRLECRTAWWERSEYATALGAVPIPQSPLETKEEALDTERVGPGSTRATTLERSEPPRVRSVAFNDKGLISLCPQCGQKNRIPFSHISQVGRCGACKALLPVPSRPLTIDNETHFAALVSSCPVPLLVDFWAQWCGPCRMVAPELEKVAAANTGQLIVVKVNTEELPALAQQFRIHSIPTMAIFLRGREVSRTAGVHTAAAIQEFARQAVKASSPPTVLPSRVVRTLSGHTNCVNSVAFSPDGQRLASGSTDKTVKLWEVASGRELRTLSGHTDWVNAVAFSLNRPLLASGGSSLDCTIKVWIDSGDRGFYTLSGHTNSVHAVVFSPDGRLLASASGGGEEGADRVIALREVPSWRVLHFLTGHTKSVNAVAFSPDGRLLASGSADDSITLWEVASGRELGTLRHHGGWFLKYPLNAIAFSPDGRLLASGSGDATIKLWEVVSWQGLDLLTGHTESVNAVAFSPDGQLLASGSADSTIRLWEVAGGRKFPSMHTLTGHTKSVNAVAFSPDGRLLASGSADNTIKLWQ